MFVRKEKATNLVAKQYSSFAEWLMILFVTCQEKLKKEKEGKNL